MILATGTPFFFSSTAWPITARSASRTAGLAAERLARVSAMRRRRAFTSGITCVGGLASASSCSQSRSSRSSSALVLASTIPARMAAITFSRSRRACASRRLASSRCPCWATSCFEIAACHARMAWSDSSASRTPASMAASAWRRFTRTPPAQVPRSLAVEQP
ncbi:MAG TPA: hypothetical protein VIG97_14430 [Luteimonas sp.]